MTSESFCWGVGYTLGRVLAGWGERVEASPRSRRQTADHARNQRLSAINRTKMYNDQLLHQRPHADRPVDFLQDIPI
jgi:hypothetical protein